MVWLLPWYVWYSYRTHGSFIHEYVFFVVFFLSFFVIPRSRFFFFLVLCTYKRGEPRGFGSFRSPVFSECPAAFSCSPLGASPLQGIATKTTITLGFTNRLRRSVSTRQYGWWDHVAFPPCVPYDSLALFLGTPVSYRPSKHTLYSPIFVGQCLSVIFCRQFLWSTFAVNFCRQVLSSIFVVNFCRQFFVVNFFVCRIFRPSYFFSVIFFVGHFLSSKGFHYVWWMFFDVVLLLIVVARGRFLLHSNEGQVT